MTTFTLVSAKTWESWRTDSETWEGLWALVSAMYETHSMYATIRVADTATEVSVVSNTKDLWLIDLVQSSPPFMVDVFGGTVPISYDTACLTWVQVEEGELDDDSPPAGFWLPLELALDETRAHDLAAEVLGLEAANRDAAETAATRIELFPDRIASSDG